MVDNYYDVREAISLSKNENTHVTKLYEYNYDGTQLSKRLERTQMLIVMKIYTHNKVH